MEYQSILNLVEQQKKDENLSAKLFRYTGLMQAIEFFSQKLNFDQIVDAASDFVNELLTLEKSAVFIKTKQGPYRIKKSKGYLNDITEIPVSENFNDLVTLHGTIIRKHQEMALFLPEDFIQTYRVSSHIPLVVDNNPIGFIVLSNKAVGEFNSDDYIISEALMRLINKSFEYGRSLEALNETNMELDRKIFNLFAIHHSTKALLSEMNLEILYSMSVEVFAELTQCTKTGFVLYDEKSETYEMKAFKDVYNMYNKPVLSLTHNFLKRVDHNKIIMDLSDEKDRKYFLSLFPDSLKVVDQAGGKYIVMLLKNGRILGFVLLGDTVTGQPYDKSMFELIESLASYTYIAFSNAKLFKEVAAHRELLQTKLDKLISLNTLMKNINSSVNIPTLLELTLKTLEVSFNVDKGLAALYHAQENRLEISMMTNIETSVKTIPLTEAWANLYKCELICEADSDKVQNYIEAQLLSDIGPNSGIVVIPIYTEDIEQTLIGALILFNFKEAMINEEENLLTLETIANHIAPVLGNLSMVERQKRFLLPNYIEIFKDALRDEINRAREKGTKLEILQIQDEKDFIFKGNNIAKLLEGRIRQVYPVSYNHLFVILEKDFDMARKEIQNILSGQKVSFRELVLGRDFKDFKTFFELFQ